MAPGILRSVGTFRTRQVPADLLLDGRIGAYSDALHLVSGSTHHSPISVFRKVNHDFYIAVLALFGLLWVSAWQLMPTIARIRHLGTTWTFADSLTPARIVTAAACFLGGALISILRLIDDATIAASVIWRAWPSPCCTVCGPQALFWREPRTFVGVKPETPAGCLRYFIALSQRVI